MATISRGDRYITKRKVRISELTDEDTILVVASDGSASEISYEDLYDQISASISAGTGKTTREIYENQLLLSR